MRSIKLTVAYDGSAYAGWQIQQDRRTVQAVIEAALSKITGETVRVTASGRTDTGVHALAQVVGFRTASKHSLDVFRRALNAELPHDIAVLETAEAPEGFHATLHAKRKRYRYVIDNGRIRDVFRRTYAWWHPAPLDADAMHVAAQCLLGTHDFRSFETSGSERKTSVRTIYDIFVRREAGQGSDTITMEVEANGFLYNMVRTIVGSLARVGRGAESPSWIGEVLAACDRRRAGPTAPPQGLFLVRVEYDEAANAGAGSPEYTIQNSE